MGSRPVSILIQRASFRVRGNTVTRLVLSILVYWVVVWRTMWSLKFVRSSWCVLFLNIVVDVRTHPMIGMGWVRPPECRVSSISSCNQLKRIRTSCAYIHGRMYITICGRQSICPTLRFLQQGPWWVLLTAASSRPKFCACGSYISDS